MDGHTSSELNTAEGRVIVINDSRTNKSMKEQEEEEEDICPAMRTILTEHTKTPEY